MTTKYTTSSFYLKCSKCLAEASYTGTELLAAKFLERRPGWCRCGNSDYTKMIPGDLKHS